MKTLRMTHRGFSSQSIRAGGALLLGALLLIGVMAPVRPVKAQQVQRAVLAPIQVPTGHTLQLSVVNADNKPVGVRLQFLNAADFSPLDSSSPFVLGPRTGDFRSCMYPLCGGFVAPAIELVQGQAGSDSSIQVSVQMFDAGGQTVAFAGSTERYDPYKN